MSSQPGTSLPERNSYFPRLHKRSKIGNKTHVNTDNKVTILVGSKNSNSKNSKLLGASCDLNIPNTFFLNTLSQIQSMHNCCTHRHVKLRSEHLSVC